MVLTIALALAAGPAPLSDPVEIVRRLATADRRSRELVSQYTYVVRTEEREFDARGNVIKSESKTSDVFYLFGRRYERLTHKDGKPLTGKDAEKEEEKFQKELAKRQKEPEKEREKLAKEDAKRREELRKLVDEIVKAYHLTLEGTDSIDGRAAYRIAAEPRQDYRRLTLPYSALSRLRGRMWIDAEEFQMVKAEAEVIETVSIGLILARASPGTKLRFEQTRVNREIWLPKSAGVQLDGRLGLVKKVRGESRAEWSNYRKFSTDSRVVDVAGTAAPQ
jgi:hypothetical protein